MATRFVRVDLAEDAVDFRPIAIEPGVPLLDTAGANDKIMFKWLGGLIAEPEWQEDGHSVNFYVRDEQGGRLEEATVQLVEEGDLEGPLAGQVEQIRERLNSAKAYSGAEDMMLRLVKSLFNEIIDTPEYPGRLAFFFKYKDANDNVVSDGAEIQATDINAPYTITRKGEWRSSINLEANWYDPDFEWDSGNRHEHLDWYFSALGASMYDVWLASDPHATASPLPVAYPMATFPGACLK